MKKQEVKIVKAAVQRSAKLDQGMKVELGLTDKKEQQRLNKTFKPFAADPIVKKAVKGRALHSGWAVSNCWMASSCPYCRLTASASAWCTCSRATRPVN